MLIRKRLIIRKRPEAFMFTDEEMAIRSELAANELTPSQKGALNNRRKPVTLPIVWKDK